MDKITLPTEKIYGQRFAQLIWNALAFKYGQQNLHSKLWTIENAELETALDEYLQHLDQFGTDKETTNGDDQTSQ